MERIDFEDGANDTLEIDKDELANVRVSSSAAARNLPRPRVPHLRSSFEAYRNQLEGGNWVIIMSDTLSYFYLWFNLIEMNLIRASNIKYKNKSIDMIKQNEKLDL